MLIGKSVALFVLAGLFEIGGGYLVWQWWRNGAPWFLGAIGAIVNPFQFNRTRMNRAREKIGGTRQ
ncbi:MAG: hypothetical protein HY803_06410 [candidate division NC10 bacterium]|nr:hypothetical protein [candidate division NC10 bacterium]